MATTKDYAMREGRLRQIREGALQKAEQTVWPPAHLAEAAPAAGYYGQPVLKRPAWTWEVPLYFFIGGAAGAASVLASMAKLNDADAKLIRDAQWLAAIGGFVSPALLTADLGMPARFLNMLRVFKVQSPMSVGSWTLVAFSSSAAATALLGEFERRTGRTVPVLREAAPVASVLSGLMLSTYTGVLVGATAIPAWNENVRLLPIQFAASGLAAAASILELRGHQTPALNLLGIGAAAVETAAGVALEIRRPAGTEPLRCGPTGWAMRTAGFLSGPLPLFLRLLALGVSRNRSRQLRRAASLSAVAGSLVKRWAWVQAGRASAQDPRPALLASPVEQKELPCSSETEKTLPKVRAAQAENTLVGHRFDRWH